MLSAHRGTVSGLIPIYFLAIATLEKSLSHRSDVCAPWGEPEHLEHGPLVQRTLKKSKGFFPLIGTLSSASEKHEHGIGVAGLQPTSHTPSNLLQHAWRVSMVHRGAGGGKERPHASCLCSS